MLSPWDMKCLCLSLTGLSNDLGKVGGPRQSQSIGGNQDGKVGRTETAYSLKDTKNKNQWSFQETTQINRKDSLQLSGFVWPKKGSSLQQSYVYSVHKVALMSPSEVNCILTLCA